MKRAKLSRTQLALKDLKKCMRRAIDRDKLYQRLSKDYKLKPSTIRAAASKAHITSKEESLQKVFSVKEEEALVEICVRQSRQYRPFTIPDFCRMARKFAGLRKNGQFLTAKFAEGFVKRHRQTLCMRRGKVTSPKRTSSVMMSNAQDFIDMINTKMARNTANSQNIVVFDETGFGDSVSVPVVIGERRKSAGSNINVAETRHARLGTYIPFSLPDGTTPFRVFILKEKDLNTDGGMCTVLAPKNEIGLRGDPYRLYLASDSGFLNKTLFEYIIIEFAKWWNTTRSGLECFMISDNLPIHTNERIVSIAESMGIHMYNIMPGTSHWFQVHDQQPFGVLKKNMGRKKFDLLTSTVTTDKSKQDLLMALFYQAEASAFGKEVVCKAFSDVGLWPWDPETILKNCLENSPPDPPLHKSRLVSKLLNIIAMMDYEKCQTIRQLKSSLSERPVITQKEIEEKNAQEQEKREKLLEKQEHALLQRTETMERISTEPSAKRPRCKKNN